MSDRKLLGENLTLEERVSLAQLASQPGWPILVRLMAEECRLATEEVIKLDPASDRYAEIIVALQTKARAMHKFSTDVLDSVRVHQRRALNNEKVKSASTKEEEVQHRFTGFNFPKVQSPEGV